MTICSDCYWAEQCGGLTTRACSDYTPLAEDQTACEEYLENVRADCFTYAKTIPDLNESGSVYHKFRDTAQHLCL